MITLTITSAGASSASNATANTAKDSPPYLIPIIPAPAKITPKPGAFNLNRQTTLVCAAGLGSDAAGYLQAQLRALGWDLALVPSPGTPDFPNAIELVVDSGYKANTASDDHGAGAYTLVVSPARIGLRAASADGLFSGAGSIVQLAAGLGNGRGADVAIPAMAIEDSPRMSWRGLMLDESRHFFGKAVVKELLDTMAYLKMNRFHWHLTDEPGWRIEIRRYPRLTEIGATGDSSDPKAAPAFYTQTDIRELVAYAEQRHIMIVPEIDFPGHATAATRAYPELSGGGAGKWSGFTFNPARETTYQFMTGVLQEIAALFPGPYIHIGGDEVSYGNQDWNSDPEIVRFTRDHGLKDATALEGYAVRRVAAIAHNLGKIAIGWDEIARDGVIADGSIAMWWHHERPEVLQNLLVRGYSVILCPRLPCYFDFVQTDTHQVGRRWKGAYVDLHSVYRFPDFETGEALPAANAPGVVGIEACEWTEVIQDRDRLCFMLFPRLAALAEAAWSPAGEKDYSNFIGRLPEFLRALDRRGIPYFDPFHPEKTPEPAGPKKASGLTGSG